MLECWSAGELASWVPDSARRPRPISGYIVLLQATQKSGELRVNSELQVCNSLYLQDGPDHVYRLGNSRGNLGELEQN